MKVSSKLIEHPHYMDWNRPNEIPYLLITVFLRHENIINHEKMMAMFRGIKDGSLDKTRNTYHCKINNKWYSQEPMLSILKEAFYYHFPNGCSMEFKYFIPYLITYLNKPRNYAIDFFMSNVVESALRSYAVRYNSDYAAVESFGIGHVLTYYDYDRYEPSGYCCEDCDGDYERYKESEFRNYYFEQNLKDLKKQFSDALHKYKKTYKGYEIPKKEIS